MATDRQIGFLSDLKRKPDVILVEMDTQAYDEYRTIMAQLEKHRGTDGKLPLANPDAPQQEQPQKPEVPVDMAIAPSIYVYNPRIQLPTWLLSHESFVGPLTCIIAHIL